MSPESAYAELIRRSKEAAVLSSCGAVLGWDERTYMPHNGSTFRGDQMALVARLTHEMTTHPHVGECLATIESSSLVQDADAPTAINVRELRRAYDRAVKLPKELVEEIARVTTQAQQVWQEARAKNDFPAFLPWLERIVALKRREADAVGFKEHPYDALLDEYEPGMRSSEVRAVFAALSAELVPLIAAIGESKQTPRRDVLEADYPVEVQQALVREAAAGIGFDFEAGRLDVTTHPFCSGIGPGDCRITTRFNPRFFNEAFFGVLHEAGHGIYEQGLPTEHFGTPLGSYCSLGIHESQSRLWENQVGRGRPFWTHFFPKAKKAFPAALTRVSLDEFLFAINGVRPSLIRVEADEATYNLHIILRFELELALLTGDLQPKDVPTAWNERFRTMFGLTPPDDRQGCLQDIHWSMGGLGYFPTYTLGNLYAAQLMDACRAQLPSLEEDFTRGEFGQLKSWLNDKVHKPGRSYRSDELCRRVTGNGLQHGPLIAYLREKYGQLYRL
ncbi:MAG TPA: carboxypeptidase M32 [Gemmataceae bacterium]|jgi:carboxypeptidase Taq|nr:carboxypeptidase M32 [Gemmataceae bacterium]